MKEKMNILVIGAGSWGTTLSVMLAQKGYNIKIWTRSKNTFNEILKNRTNTKYTGKLIIPENVSPFINKDEGFENEDGSLRNVRKRGNRDFLI